MTNTQTTTSLFIYALSGTIFEGPVVAVRVPAEDGELSILPSHTPIVTPLKKGTIRAHTEDAGGKEFFIENGIVYADQTSVICLITE